MKNFIIFTLLALALSIPAFAQPTAGPLHLFDQRIVYDKTNYTASLAETTGWLSTEPFRELTAMFQSTDSVFVVVFVDARNSTVPTNFTSVIPGAGLLTTSDTLSLRDSTSGSANMNTGGVRRVLYKSTTLNRLDGPVNNQLRMRINYQSTLTGTTTGRRFKIHLIKTN